MSSTYSIVVTPAARRQSKSLPLALRQRAEKAIDSLRSDPRGRHTQKLGGNDAYRIRDGKLRILFLIEDARRLVTVTRVSDRKQAYRRLARLN